MTVLAPGVRVKCIKKDSWRSYAYGAVIRDGFGPMFGSVWIVSGVHTRESYMGKIGISIAGWPNPNSVFNSKRFVQLDGNEDISLLTEALNKGPVNDIERILEHATL